MRDSDRLQAERAGGESLLPRPRSDGDCERFVIGSRRLAAALGDGRGHRSRAGDLGADKACDTRDFVDGLRRTGSGANRRHRGYALARGAIGYASFHGC